jgi:hypothetical protein
VVVQVMPTPTPLLLTGLTLAFIGVLIQLPRHPGRSWMPSTKAGHWLITMVPICCSLIQVEPR